MTLKMCNIGLVSFTSFQDVRILYVVDVSRFIKFQPIQKF